MRILIAAVGRAKAGPERELYEHYRGRVIQPFSLELKEVEEKRSLSAPELKQREGELLLAAIPDGAITVALDERGKAASSAEFAKMLGHWRDDGIRDVVFLIGGAGGLADPVRAAASHVMSFGAATWPHMLVRGLLAEQVYRAQSILSGHPYHRE
ncbi:MAG: 23S rRNA (pseudouridine(1915)-N(3))-methyltransferase RlmH [Rhodospirillaceae bacterium]|nr:23S rRNA (pseudouridine(1915)-N(3))-methyltransferase RlmH [Rhodospirillaceae bacterium]